MSEKAQRAKALFLEGYNCAQAVAGAFAPEMGLSVDAAARLASGFGGGMGRMREVCGAVSGMTLAASALRGYNDPKAGPEKTDTYAMIQELAGRFRAENGSIICRSCWAWPVPRAHRRPRRVRRNIIKSAPARSWWRWRLKFWRNGWQSILPGCKFRIPTKCGSLILVYFTIINLLDDINLTIIDNSGVCTVL